MSAVLSRKRATVVCYIIFHVSVLVKVWLLNKVAARFFIKLFNRNNFDIVTTSRAEEWSRWWNETADVRCITKEGSVCEEDTEAGGRATDEERANWTDITSCNTTVTANRFMWCCLSIHRVYLSACVLSWHLDFMTKRRRRWVVARWGGWPRSVDGGDRSDDRQRRRRRPRNKRETRR